MEQDTGSTASADSAAALTDAQLRRAVGVVALANLAYFFVEFGVARRIGSVSLFADSIDFLEDTAVNFLIFGLRATGHASAWFSRPSC